MQVSVHRGNMESAKRAIGKYTTLETAKRKLNITRTSWLYRSLHMYKNYFAVVYSQNFVRQLSYDLMTSWFSQKIEVCIFWKLLEAQTFRSNDRVIWSIKTYCVITEVHLGYPVSWLCRSLPRCCTYEKYSWSYSFIWFVRNGRASIFHEERESIFCISGIVA